MAQKKKRANTDAARRRPKRRKRSSTLERVRDGVRRFILNDASIGEFHKALRAANARGEASPHPLTGVAFRRIVQEVLDEQKREATKRRKR